MASPATHRHTAKSIVPAMIFSSVDIAPLARSSRSASSGASGVAVISGFSMMYRINGVRIKPK